MLRGPLRFEMVDDEMAALMRAKTPAERVACVTAANHTARLLASAGIRHQHPEWDDAKVKAEVARRMSRGTG